jgi:Tfp pilus assembly protein PilF
MKEVLHRRLLIAALLSLVFCVAPAYSKDEWVRVQSPNFSLIGNGSEKEIRRVATKFEQFREVLKLVFPKLQFTSSVPTTVIIFKNSKSFTPYKPLTADGKANKWIAGYFRGGEDANYIVLTTEGESEQTYTTVFHEYMHFLVNNSFGRSRVPPWFNEGLAEFYDQFAIEGDQKVFLGNLNSNHLATLQSSKLIPLEQFLNTNYYSLHQQGGHGANIFYAQSWAFVHYLMLGNPDRAGQLQTFLAQVVDGAAPKDAFSKTFKTDFAGMEKELKKYVEQRSFLRSVVTLPQKLVFDASMQSFPLSNADAQARLGDLLLHSNRLAEAEAHLNDSLAQDPASTFAQTSMALVRMRQKKFPEAKQLLEKALKGEANNHLVHYRYAYVLSRESMDDNNYFRGFPDESAKKMREALRKSIALNPEFPESYGLLSFISIVRNDEVDESINYIGKALRLSPGNEDYILNLAALYSRKEQFDKAKALAESVYKSSQEQNTRSRAQGILQNIESFREYVAARNKVTERQHVIVSEKPLTEAELARQEAEAQSQSLLGALRKPREGEQRVLGSLSKIECSRDLLTFSFKTDSKTMQLWSKDFQAVELMSFVPTAEVELGCSKVIEEAVTVVTYVPDKDPKSRTTGRLIAIEWVPKDFKLPSN